jgi:hypothetical protein
VVGESPHVLLTRQLLLTLFPVLVVSVVSVGCEQGPRGWTYTAIQPADRRPMVTKSVAVPPFRDERSSKDPELISMLLLLPFFPSGTAEVYKPEFQRDLGYRHRMSGDSWKSFKPTEDIAKALAEELRNSHLFNEAFFTFRETEGDLILRGTVSSTRLEVTMYSYGLSLAFPIPWLLGFPAYKITNELSFHLQLEDKTSTKVIWEKGYTAAHEVRWSYYNRVSGFWFDVILKELMPTILSDLEQAARSARFALALGSVN